MLPQFDRDRGTFRVRGVEESMEVIEKKLSEAGIPVACGLRDLESQIQETLDLLAKEYKAKKTSPSRSNLLLARNEMLRRLLDRQDEMARQSQAESPLLAELAAAKGEIESLKGEIATVKVLPARVIEKVIDQDASLRAERDALIEVTSLLASIHVGSHQLAVKAIKQLSPAAAEIVCKQCGVDYKTWRGYAYSYPSDWSWKQVLNAAVTHDTDLCRFCLASLEEAGIPYVPLTE